MKAIRQPAVAGMFYPADRQTLVAMLEDYLAAAGTGPAPKAMIVPHAGYVYSGPVAATGYARLRQVASRIRRVVLIGPAHRVALRGLAVPAADSFMTPLGEVPLDTDAIAQISSLPQVHIDDEAHRQEHSLEVQLPFLQATLDDFKLVPIVAGDVSADAVCAVIERLWGGDETLFIISSDLSHYHDYATAKQLDKATSQAIEALDFEAIDYDHACGRNPVSGILLYARRHGLAASMIDLRNSGDTAGPRDQVVGYGTYVINADQ